MHALQHKMLGSIDAAASFLGWTSPSQKYDASCPLLRYKIDDLLRKALPTLASVAVRFMSSHS